MSGDQYSYWYYGHEIAAGRGYISYATACYPIGFPAILAVVFWLSQHTFLPSDVLAASCSYGRSRSGSSSACSRP